MCLKALLLGAAATVMAMTAGAAYADASAAGHPDWPGAGQLFVGACYQPVDRSPEEIRNDIALMKKAGFKVVRMGDLSWDYFEPAEGAYTFKAFDSVMDQMNAAGIKVILDISGLPAPIWLHYKYPGVNLVAQNGTTLYPAERYMDDISDPDYQRLVKDFADTLTKHYADHPALLAIGFDNEIGNGFMSWSEADRQRFIVWLKNRYGNLDTLNKVWATQNWSRRIDNWDEVRLPYGDGPGPFERYLDLHRFWSDVTVNDLKDLEAIREKNVPDKPAISNLWPGAGRKGFDYLSSYRDYVSYGAFGYYAGDPISGAFETMWMKGALQTPSWFNEFQAGGGGFYGAKGYSRMLAYFGLINGGQGFLAWTFNSHLGGEEQALFGLVDHDNTPSWKLGEWGQIASEFKTMEKMGFPRKLDPQVAFAYSFDTAIATTPVSPSNTVKQYIAMPYLDQEHNAFAPIFNDNIDTAVINVGHEDLSPYKLVVVAGDYLMDKASADHLRAYIQNGGTVIMTAQSAKVDEHNQWFDTPLPGRLSDVFGLKTNEFYRNSGPLKGKIGDTEFATTNTFYEILEPSTAKVIARFSNLDGTPPAVTVNKFGKGQAIYVAAMADPSMLQALYRSLYSQLSIVPGPKTPEGVYARVVDGRTLYVNASGSAKDVPVDGDKKGLLSGKTWHGTLHLDKDGVDLLQ
ncbi:beta-galactosidase [Asticcacaulis sp. EMRT-3]|uniref:beta-galactosidase n=1 Tax=Asticcacaulis sp. EMRT-3 TaxID=3040349 RepID=UPI0024AFFF4F|nr:beta-galactosidase [Asticcacaulis sp. EMRT-3]MDI7775080.1 beta-galactosidase [Asticcacaulis sp. EMRT-3]